MRGAVGLRLLSLPSSSCAILDTLQVSLEQPKAFSSLESSTGSRDTLISQPSLPRAALAGRGVQLLLPGLLPRPGQFLSAP